MDKTADVLKSILSDKRQEIEQARSKVSISELKSRIADSEEVCGFEEKLRTCINQCRPAVIAECKKASPSKGIMRPDYNVREIAASYQKWGATCMSVLTDQKYFQGSLHDIGQARSVASLPILRKDFMLDPYQILESRAAGADCILLIASALELHQMNDLASLAAEYKLDVLIEVHSNDELDKALEIPIGMIGINNRNLHTFETSLQTTLQLVEHIPSGRMVVTESGIHTRQDVQLMMENNIFAFLVGEAFMRSEDPGQKLQELFFSGGLTHGKQVA